VGASATEDQQSLSRIQAEKHPVPRTMGIGIIGAHAPLFPYCNIAVRENR